MYCINKVITHQQNEWLDGCEQSQRLPIQLILPSIKIKILYELKFSKK